uniref:Dynactin associated protein n=1 Tax=Propithecus coquereli TaxID=379532 RepID=A0A2K6GQE0_PROCO
IKGSEQTGKYSWSEACDIGSSMDKKQGKYVVNVEHSENQPLKGNCRQDWSLWKVFLACLLACVVTTAIGVLIICLVNNKGNDNVSVVIQLPRNNGEPIVTSPGTTSTTSQTTGTTSMEPTMTTSTDTTATTSTQSTT